MKKRSTNVQRNTLETQITVQINLDGTGKSHFETGVPFLEHMLDQVARHGIIDLEIIAKGDLHIDAHHTVEDIGITLGQAFTKALGDKKLRRRHSREEEPPAPGHQPPEHEKIRKKKDYSKGKIYIIRCVSDDSLF